jgi:hypothetical protein
MNAYIDNPIAIFLQSLLNLTKILLLLPGVRKIGKRQGLDPLVKEIAFLARVDHV